MANGSATNGPPSPADSITQVYAVNRHGTVTMPTREAGVESPSLFATCAAAEWYCRQATVLRHGEVAEFGRQFTTCLTRLAPEVEGMTERLDPGDVEAGTALAAVRMARVRMGCPEAPGLMGESERVGDLALSVGALVHHREKLTAALEAR
ncbi:DUF6415 family natural product biosynthesis protein [Streptomyces acidiscabies]|uniref:DUF6415 family natural product biosynthesis protein n=1 Tax=Streptomyces acidiscabies TaxID=42234 RepID=UPI0038F802B0